MPLTLQSQNVEQVVVIRCQGRIVLGDEIHALQLEVGKIRHLKKRVVLQLAEVDYIDSAGLGALVRLFGQLRVGGGGLKLCQMSPFVLKVLQATHLLGTMPNYASEKDALEAFSEGSGPLEKTPSTPRMKIVCLDSSSDVLAYLKAILTQAGYEVFTAKQMSDARTFIVATGTRVVIYGLGAQTSESVIEKFRESHPKVQVLLLPTDFSTAEASQAGAELLERLRSVLANHP
ncbi:MAG: STAS domain-containing protein [Candidatus Acidiferrales bacterium]